MVDSKKNNDSSTENFADDLDAMLKDVEKSTSANEDIIDDEDAIDRLLMDDTFDTDHEDVEADDVDALLEQTLSQESKKAGTDTGDEFADESVDLSIKSDEDDVSESAKRSHAEIKDNDQFDEDALLDSIAMGENEIKVDDEFDEFADDVIEAEQKTNDRVVGSDPGIENKNSFEQNDKMDKFDVDELLDSIGNDENEEEKHDIEIDEFAEDPNNLHAEEQNEALTADDDFLMADFDISADDDVFVDPESSVVNNEIDEFAEDEFAATDAEQESIDQNEELLTEPEKEPSEGIETKTKSDFSPTENIELNKGVFDEINAQLSQLWAENEVLKQQISDLSNSNGEKDSTAEEINSLQKEQFKLKKLLKESEAKVPVITYVTLGIAIAALLSSVVIGFISYGVQDKFANLEELVATVEEELDIIVADDTPRKVKIIEDKMASLAAKDDLLSKQLVIKVQDLENKINSKTNSLQPVVDDLVEQNEHAQIAIEQLLAKVDTLEKRKAIPVSTKKTKKAVAKANWVVNLVSFKQQWYAKRKALEFEKKGVPAQVSKVDVDGKDWFRLRVKGFKSKYEAAAYAVKVKKTLNLTSVWVTKENAR